MKKLSEQVRVLTGTLDYWANKVAQLEIENRDWHKVNAENTELMEAMMSRIKELEEGEDNEDIRR